MLQEIWCDAATSPRLFPSIAGNPYRLQAKASARSSPPETLELSVDQIAACELLKRATQRLPRSVRIGRTTPGAAAVWRLLYLHSNAVASEGAHDFPRADFWWNQLSSQWLVLREPERWKEVAEELKRTQRAEVLSDPAELRSRLAHELLVDTHLGLYNGLIAARSSECRSRAERHRNLACEYASDSQRQSIEPRAAEIELEASKGRGSLIESVRLADGLVRANSGNRAYRRELHELHAKAMQECLAAGKTVDELELVEMLVFHEPNRVEHQDRVVELRMRLADAATPAGGTDEEKARRRADLLQKQIEALVTLRKSCPGCLIVYEALPILHHWRAIALANGDRPSGALLDLEKALAYKPGWKDAEQSRSKVEAMLTHLMRQMSDLKAQLQKSNRPGVMSVLSAEGKALQSEVETGFKPPTPISGWW